MRNKVFICIVVVLALLLLFWVAPDTDVEVGSCENGVRTPITWVITNKENGFPEAPGYITDIVISPDFPTTEFTPQPLPNTGSATAEATTDVPEDFEGVISLSYNMEWREDGYIKDVRAGSESVEVTKCELPPTTTSTTTSTSTTIPPTTVLPTTSTTAPSTTSTVPPTTTTTEPPTSTTVAPTTTTTVITTTTTEPATTIPPTTVAPTTTEPETTTTWPVLPTQPTLPPHSTPPEPTESTRPSTTVTVDTPPAEPVPASPSFTG